MTPAGRIAGFTAHLRLNGFALGPAETADAAALLAAMPPDPAAARLGLRALLCGDRAQWERFDALFDAWWHGAGVKISTPDPQRAPGKARPALWNRVLPAEEGAPQRGASARASDGTGDGDGATASGRLVASDQRAIARTDLRHLATPDAIAEAELVAERLARALRHRLSRRRIPSSRGRRLDLRRTIRRNLAHGGEPLELVRRRRPDRPATLVLLLDVSGSMKLYSRFFLLFVRALVGSTLRADAYLFHTRLVRITDALRETDPLTAMTRLALMAEGFGGGTRIAGALKAFNDRHAAAAIDSRSVVIVMSDGYDTDPPERLAVEMARLRKRARRLVWLNPLLGWRDYAPVARGMAAALPFVDRFATAHTLASLAALEPELARL